MHTYLSDFHVIRPDFEIEQEQVLEWIAKAHAYVETYRNNLKNRNFDKEVPQNFCPERAAIAGRQDASEGKSFEVKPTQLKTDSSGCFGINREGGNKEQYEMHYSTFRERLFKLGLGKEKLEKRSVHIADFSEENWERMNIYRLHEHYQGASLTQRTELFDALVSEIFQRFYPETTALPDHLIHVTCTGYSAPSGAQKIVAQRKSQTMVTHAYHMGCYGSLPAIRMGIGFVCSPFSSEETYADIVHTELCSLHFNPESHSQEQCVIQTLFADGFIKYSVRKSQPNTHSFQMIALHEELIEDSTKSMSWKCGERGFLMTISKEVPYLFSKIMPTFLSRLIQKSGLSAEMLFSRALFAIHPGGPKIIEQIAQLLKLEPFQIRHSKEVLKSYGNMSSATLPHVWDKMIQDPEVATGTPIVSLALGPGLTASGMLFIKI